MTPNNLISYNISESVAQITLNRPEVLNSFNRAMALELQDALRQSGDNDSVRAVYLTGAGRAFCAGQDLGEATAIGSKPIDAIVREQYNPIITLIREMEKPVVCAVNGIAAGAGANVALACDIVVAAASANFVQAFCKIALIPDSGGTFFLPRLVGFQRASALMMTGDKVSAQEAMNMGMIYKVFDDVAFAEESLNLAKRLASLPTRGLGLTKKALNSSLFNNLQAQLEEEGRLQMQAAAGEDFKEGVMAFLEKRPPVFTGK